MPGPAALRRMGPGAQVALRLLAVVAMIPALVLVSAAQHAPASLAHATWGLGETPGDAMEARGPYAVAFLDDLTYNATRDATLAGALICSHAPCGPLVWVRGNLTGKGPFLLQPASGRLTVEDVTPPPARSDADAPRSPSPPPFRPHGENPSQYDHVRVAIAEPFDAEPAAPHALRASLLALAPLPLLALAPQGIPVWRRGLVLAGVALGWGLAFAEREETWGLLGYYFLLGLATVGALLTLLGVGLARRRVQPEAVAVLAFTLSFFAAIAALKPYFPVAGGE